MSKKDRLIFVLKLFEHRFSDSGWVPSVIWTRRQQKETKEGRGRGTRAATCRSVAWRPLAMWRPPKINTRSRAVYKFSPNETSGRGLNSHYFWSELCAPQWCRRCVDRLRSMAAWPSLDSAGSAAEMWDQHRPIAETESSTERSERRGPVTGKVGRTEGQFSKCRMKKSSTWSFSPISIKRGCSFQCN